MEEDTCLGVLSNYVCFLLFETLESTHGDRCTAVMDSILSAEQVTPLRMLKYPYHFLQYTSLARIVRVVRDPGRNIWDC